MLIYLDANIVQYYADWEAKFPPDPKLALELQALDEISELAAHAETQDLDHRWDVAAPEHLLEELEHGRPSEGQLDTYRALREAWRDLGVEKHGTPGAKVVERAQTRLGRLKLKDPADTLHLAEAAAMGAAWFLTCDKEVLRKTRDKNKPNEPGVIEGVTVGYPSEVRARMSFDPVFGLQLERSSPEQSTRGSVAPTDDLPLFHQDSAPGDFRGQPLYSEL
jgi:predicted nucleic acid-binding protein